MSLFNNIAMLLFILLFILPTHELDVYFDQLWNQSLCQYANDNQCVAAQSQFDTNEIMNVTVQ